MSREQICAWMLAPVWVVVGASLPDPWRKHFLSVGQFIVSSVEWTGETFQQSLDGLPSDWSFVVYVQELSAVLVGVLVLALLIVLAVELAPKLGFRS